ncbi:unnamed protein product [Brassica oleracea var. botrytis]
MQTKVDKCEGRTVMFSGGCLLYPRRIWKGTAERRVAN